MTEIVESENMQNLEKEPENIFQQTNSQEDPGSDENKLEKMMQDQGGCEQANGQGEVNSEGNITEQATSPGQAMDVLNQLQENTQEQGTATEQSSSQLQSMNNESQNSTMHEVMEEQASVIVESTSQLQARSQEQAPDQVHVEMQANSQEEANSQDHANSQGQASSQGQSSCTYICEFCSASFANKEEFLLHFAKSACKIQHIGRIETPQKSEHAPPQVAMANNEAESSSTTSQNENVTTSAPQILCTVDMILCEQGNKIFIAPDNVRVGEQQTNLQQILSICQLQERNRGTKDQIEGDTSNTSSAQHIVISDSMNSNVLASTGAVVTVQDINEHAEGTGLRCENEVQINEENMEIQVVIQESGTDAVDDDDGMQGNDTSAVEVVSLTTTDAIYKCNVCDKVFKKAAGLERHRTVHSKDSSRNFPCDTCGRSFTTMNRLVKHEEIHEKTREEEHRRKHEQQELEVKTESGEKLETFTCETCEKTFDQSCCLLEHERIHFKENLKKSKDTFPCEICDKWFHAASHLARHVKSHDRKSGFECETCGEMFQRHSTLMKHKAIHSDVKPFLCNVCGRGFMQSSNLTTHLRIHTKVKPYLCSTCGKAFSHSSSRVIHERTHTGDKPYLCQTCGKRFRQSGDLAKHQRCHTGEKPYQCAVCSKTFSVQSNLLAHLRIHVKKTGPNPLAVADQITMVMAEGSAEDIATVATSE